jgi:hypothetical protein
LLQPVSAQIAILQIAVIEGEGVVHVPGSRSSRPLTVEITDETGKPVADAAVTFNVPGEGPGGTFPNGLRTAVVTTDLRGRASLRGLQVNRIPGRFQIRIFASKEQARAGTVSFQYIAETGNSARAPSAVPERTPAPPKQAPAPASASREAPPAPSPPARDASPATAPASAQATHRHRSKWFVMAALAGGGAVAGLLAAGRSGTSAAPLAAQAPVLSIGSPAITLGKP